MNISQYLAAGWNTGSGGSQQKHITQKTTEESICLEKFIGDTNSSGTIVDSVKPETN